MAAQDTMAQISEETSKALSKASFSTQTEDAIKNLLTVLEQSGLFSAEAKAELEKRLFEDFYLALMAELFSSFTEENKESLVNASQTGLTEMQILELQLELYRKNKGSDIEIFAQKLYDEMAERVLKDLEILRQSVSDVEKLTDDQVRILEGMIEEKVPEEELLQKMQTFQGVSAIPQVPNVPTDDGKYTEIISLVKQGKLEEAREELNKTIYGVK